jgi:hypothetical protein
MKTHPAFITNSSSSCLIIWEIDPENYPRDMKLYRGSAVCPHCGKRLGPELGSEGDEELDDYMDDRARRVVEEKIARGCSVFYDIAYMGQYREDEQEHGSEYSGQYSFQC